MMLSTLLLVVLRVLQVTFSGKCAAGAGCCHSQQQEVVRSPQLAMGQQVAPAELTSIEQLGFGGA